MRESRSERHKNSKQKTRIWGRKQFVPYAALLLLAVFILTVWAMTNRDPGAQTAQPEPTLAKPSPGTNSDNKPSITPSPSSPKLPDSSKETAMPSATPTPAPTATTTPSPSGNGNSSGGTGNTGAVTWPGDDSRVRLSFVGDVIFASTVEYVLQDKGFDYPYTNVKPFLQDADLTIANLESPITKRGDEQKKEYVYRSPPEALPAFKEAGFDLVNLANNHILDYGVEGLIDTFDNLDKAGLKRVGAGRNVKEAFQPVVIEKKGMKIAFVSFSKVVPTADWKAGKYPDGKDRPGVADTYALEMPLESIRQAKTMADIVIVIAHWGVERNDLPEAYQKEYARKYIDAGADLIIGGHPHVLQGFESYKGKWIAYSLGNFLFTTRPDAPKTWDSTVLQASCSKQEGCELKMVPVLTKWALPQIMQQPESIKLFERLSSISFGAIVDKDGMVRKK